MWFGNWLVEWECNAKCSVYFILINIDLLRCESLYTLDDATATRILQRNYWLVFWFVCVCVCVCVCLSVCLSVCLCVSVSVYSITYYKPCYVKID